MNMTWRRPATKENTQESEAWSIVSTVGGSTKGKPCQIWQKNSQWKAYMGTVVSVQDGNWHEASNISPRPVCLGIAWGLDGWHWHLEAKKVNIWTSRCSQTFDRQPQQSLALITDIASASMRTTHALACRYYPWASSTPRAYKSYSLLQFIYFIMVSFSFRSYAGLTCSSVCIPTTGYILWFFWVHWTLLLLNSNPHRSISTTTGRDDTDWLIHAYAYHGQLSLPSDSLVSDTYSILLIHSSLFYGVLRLRVS